MQAASLPKTASIPAAAALPNILTKAIETEKATTIAAALLASGIDISFIEEELKNKGIYEDVLAQYNK